MQEAQTRKEYLSCADTAKLVRGALKKAFPGTKFSVRSKTYSGGASIRVEWTDGPASTVVDRILDQFEGKRFDGMIDMATYVSHWLNPDGTVSIAHNQGTEMSRGMIAEQFGSRQHPDAELVSLGADYVQAHRDVSDEARAWAEENHGTGRYGLNIDQTEWALLSRTSFDTGVPIPHLTEHQGHGFQSEIWCRICLQDIKGTDWRNIVVNGEPDVGHDSCIQRTA